jgi:dTDP-glucose pyrophosphorylase
MTERSLSPDSLLVDAVRAIETSRRRMAVVADEHGGLLGTLTDGDIRRSLLAGGSLDTPVSQAMNRSPVSAEVGSADGYILDLLRKANVMALPLVDEAGRYQRLVHITDLEHRGEDEGVEDARGFSFAVIMAGGEGTRLRPLTNDIPKPMVEIGGVPMLERQIERLSRAGVKRVYLSVNYLSHVIEEHFGDGSGLGLEIRYLREQERLGTAGALSLLPEQPSGPIIVMNGDILTTSDFGSLYAFHKSYGAHITVGAVDYRVNIPYGVIRADGPFVTGLAEKPSQRFLCNAGIYALSPESLQLLGGVTFTNITDLIETCLERKLPVAVFPVHEYWSDIGTPDDLEKARLLFSASASAHE